MPIKNIFKKKDTKNTGHSDPPTPVPSGGAFQLRPNTSDKPPPYSHSNEEGSSANTLRSSLYPTSALGPGSVVIPPAPNQPKPAPATPAAAANAKAQPTESDPDVESLTSYLTDTDDQLGFGKYNCREAKHIALLLVGRSQTGKSSIVSTLINPQNSILSKGISDTVNPTFHSLVVYDSQTAQLYQLNIIDSPGLGEISQADFSTRSDNIILELTKTFVKHQVTHLNMIAFVTPVGETNLLDTTYFHIIADYVGDAFKSISTLLLSKADTVNEERRLELIEAIKSSEDTKHIVNYCENGFTFSGAVNYETLVSTDNEKLQRTIVKGLLKIVGEIRQNLLHHIFSSSDKRVQVDKLKNLVENIEIAETDFVVQSLQQPQSTGAENSAVAYTSTNDQNQVKSIDYLLDDDNKNLGLEGRYSVQEAEVVNVLLVGRSHTGKSSIVRVLINPQTSCRITAWSSTREALIYRLVVQDTENKKLYHLNIIDTPGLGEAVKNSKDYRDDSTLIGLAKQCLHWEITKLNCVAFVSPLEKTIMLDTDHFKTVRAFLGEKMSPVSMLLLTHADKFGQEFKAKYVQDVKTHYKTKEIVEFCKLGVGMSGAVCLDNLRGMTQDPEALQELVRDRLKFVTEARNELLETFLKCKQAVPIEALANWNTQALDAKRSEVISAVLQRPGAK